MFYHLVANMSGPLQVQSLLMWEYSRQFSVKSSHNLHQRRTEVTKAPPLTEDIANLQNRIQILVHVTTKLHLTVKICD